MEGATGPSIVNPKQVRRSHLKSLPRSGIRARVHIIETSRSSRIVVERLDGRLSRAYKSLCAISP